MAELNDRELAEMIARDGHTWLEDYADDGIYRSIDPEGRRRRVVLVGAGASVEAGLPTSSELYEQLASLPDLHAFRHAADAVDHDVERAVQVLELFAQSDEAGTLGAGAVRLGAHVPPRGRNQSDRPAEAARLELQRIRDYVRSRFWLPESADVGYLGPLVRAQLGGTIATLNYDNALERAGAVQYEVPEKPISVLPADRSGTLRLLHLHGSIGWRHLSDHRRGVHDVRHSPEWMNPADTSLDYEPAIILGAGNKLRSYGPYLELYSAFQGALRAARTLVTIGYAWRDDHINDTIRNWAIQPVEEGEQRRRLVVGIGPRGRALPQMPDDLTRDHSDQVEVRPIAGPASDVIELLFGAKGEFGQSHIEQFRLPWCSS